MNISWPSKSQPYILGWKRGAREGYTYGAEWAESRIFTGDDWYAQYVAERNGDGDGETELGGSDTSSADVDIFEHMGGCYKHDSWGDDHFEWNLTLFGADSRKYDIVLYPKGGTAVVYSESGQYRLDTGAATLSFTPSESSGDRPSEIDLDSPWGIMAEYDSELIHVILIDGKGNKWPSDGADMR